MSLSFAHSLRRLDSWQQRSPVVGIPVAVIKKFFDDGADRLGVQIAYWGFFSRHETARWRVCLGRVEVQPIRDRGLLWENADG